MTTGGEGTPSRGLQLFPSPADIDGDRAVEAAFGAPHRRRL